MFKKVLKSVATLLAVALLLSVLPLGVSANDSFPESTVKIISFSVSCAKDEIAEYTYGSYEHDGLHNEFYWVYNNTLKCTVETENGKKLTFDSQYAMLDEFSGEFKWIKGEQSYDHHWSVGENEIEVEYMGLTAKTSIKIVNNNVKSVEAVMENDIMENRDGELMGGMEDEKYYFRYDFMPKITVTFKDNTSKEYSHIDDLEELDTYGFIASDESEDNQWQVGKHNAKLYLFGKVVDFDVNIVSGPVESLELLSEIKNEYTFYEKPALDGVTVRVNFKDGKSVIKTLSIIDGYSIDGEQCRHSFKSYSKGKFLRISYFNAYLHIPVTFPDTEETIVSAELQAAPTDKHWNNAVIMVTYENGQKIDYTVKEFFCTYEERNSNDNGAEYYSYWGLALTDKGIFEMSFYGDFDENGVFLLAQFFMFGGKDFVLENEQRSLFNADFVAENAISRKLNQGKFYSKHILEHKKLENGNYNFMYEYFFPNVGNFMYTVEVNADFKTTAVSAGVQKGDVNGDGTVDIRDMIRLKKLLAEGYDNVTYNTDVERDGVLDSADTVAIRKHLLGVLF